MYTIIITDIDSLMVYHNTNQKIFETLSSLKDKDKISILFVCLGNICRSPAAEGVFRSIIESRDKTDRFIIDSAGTQGYHAGQLPDARMRAHARHRGLELTHICRRVTPADFDDFDIIIGMDDSNLHNLRQMAPTLEGSEKIIPMAALLSDVYKRYDHVPDPYYDGAEGFELVLNLLENGCSNLADALE